MKQERRRDNAGEKEGLSRREKKVVRAGGSIRREVKDGRVGERRRMREEHRIRLDRLNEHVGGSGWRSRLEDQEGGKG